MPTDHTQTFESLCSHIAEECRAQGLIESVELNEMTPAEVDKLSSHASVLWGTNVVLHSSRAQKYLGWKPSAQSLKEDIADIVRHEAMTAKTSQVSH